MDADDADESQMPLRKKRTDCLKKDVSAFCCYSGICEISVICVDSSF